MGVKRLEQSKVYCVGELLIDMFCMDRDIELKDGENFNKMPGGAPANVATTIAKLGGNASFAGKVGNDSFGDFLIETLEKFNVGTKMIKKDEYLPTTIAFVSLTAKGERDFQFNRGADQNLKIADLDVKHLMKSNIIHFGSATALLPGQSQQTYFSLIEKANTENIFISFDPNYRKDLWKGNIKEFILLSKKAISYANLVKVSEDELKLITDQDNIVEGVKMLHELGTEIVTVTMGEKGTFVSNGEEQALVPSIAVKSIDSTGAGDAFIGAILYQLSNGRKDMEKWDFEYIKEIVYFANKVGASVCQKVGSLTALPTLEEVKQLKEA